MTPSDPSPRPASPEDQDRLLDALRGELSPREQQAHEARLEADPALRAEQERLGAFLDALQAAHEVAPDRESALRISARVRQQVGAEEARIARETSRPGSARRLTRRLVWGRVLAVSVALHVLVLGVLTIRILDERQEDRQRFLHSELTLPAPGLADEDAVPEPVPAPWMGEVAREPVEPDTETIQRMWDSDGGDDGLAPLDELGDHPRHVALEMVVRRHAALKRARLGQYGLDADRTLGRVERGLKALAARQRADGSFAAGGGRSAVGETGLALLPFLGDGHGSRTGPRGPGVVAPGIAWLRDRLFWTDDAEANCRLERASDLGIALRALSEDYVLSYGYLTPGDARRRAEELRRLAAHVERTQGTDGAFPGSGEDVRAAVWPMWGLEAAVRTGAVSVPVEVPERFRRWYATLKRVRPDESDPQVAAAGLLFGRPLKNDPAARDALKATVLAASPRAVDPFFALTAGSGLLLTDADAFRAWNAELGGRLASALGPTGVVRRGDEVGDTALVLLALQSAYRTY